MPIITYNLAPVPRWLFTDMTGNVLSGGYMLTFRDVNRSQYKPVYMDINGLFPYPPQINFDLNGMAPGIFYWASDEYYYLEIYDKNGVPIFTVPMYNAPGEGTPTPPGPPTAPPSNIVRNPQFNWWDVSASWPNYQSTTSLFSDFVVDDWFFQRSNLNATINLTKQIFPIGQTDVPGSPVAFFRYECTNTGAGAETYKYLGQSYDSVYTFAGETVSFSFWAKAPVPGTISVSFEQSFGTGGSPSPLVITPVLSATLTTLWTQYTATITIPSIIGKTLGTNGDDVLFLLINYPLNAIATIDITNVQIQEGNIITSFPYLSQNEQFRRLDYDIDFSLFYTGDIKSSFNPVTPPGWIPITGGTLGNNLSGSTYAGGYVKALFEFLWNNYPGLQIYNSAGTPIARGINAEAEYNANHRLQHLDVRGLALASQSPTYPAASVVGEYTHTLIPNEIPVLQAVVSPTVGASFLVTSPSPPQFSLALGADVPVGGAGAYTQPVGGGLPHNNIQPTVFAYFFIKL